jgi:transposase
LRAISGAKYAVLRIVTTLSDPLPADLASAHAMILAQRALLEQERSALIMAQSEVKVRALEIERLKLLLAKARREQFGQSSERSKLLVEQLELAIEDLEETQAEEETKAEIAAPAAAKEKRTRAPRGPRKLPDNLPVERVVEPAPCACGKCGGLRLRKLGEVVSKALECDPRRWKIVEHVREKFACRDCEAITEAPAPSHPIPRGFAGPSLLAMILVAKFLDHQPLNRQSAAYAREGVAIDPSTLADRVGACVGALEPITARLRDHVLAAERVHADDTTVPVLAKKKTKLGRIWVYVRDDRPFSGKDPPAAFFEYSASRHGAYPRQHLAGWAGVMQADAFAGFNELYGGARKPGPITEAACWAHARRKFFDLAKLSKAPIAHEAVRRIDELFAIERCINGEMPDERRAVRQERAKPLIIALEAFLREKLALLSAKNDTAKAINYILSRWPEFTRFLDDGRVCLSNNAAERALRGVAIGRRNWTFAGSDEGGRRAAAIYTLIESCKLNDVNPQAWLAFVLAKLPDHPAKAIDELLPWNWKIAQAVAAQPTPTTAAA